MNAFGTSKGGGRRSAARSVAPLIAMVSTLSKTHSAHLLDVSSTGALLTGKNLPVRGEDVLVSIEGLKAFGVIVRSNGEERGVEFEPPLQAGEVSMLKYRVSQARGMSPDLQAALDDWALGMAR